jgi:hypothetical protein
MEGILFSIISQPEKQNYIHFELASLNNQGENHIKKWDTSWLGSTYHHKCKPDNRTQ